MPSLHVRRPDVVVVGGGMSGLAAAVDLASHGSSVLLVEQKQHCGGRSYSFLDPATGDEVDNGQHLMMGCYHSTLKFLSTIGSLSGVRIQKKLAVTFRHERMGNIHLKSASLPGAMGMLAGLVRLGSLSLLDRMKLMRVCAAVLLARPEEDERLQSITVRQWLRELGQSAASQKYFWDIIAVGTLNATPDSASAAMFATVLQKAFLGSGKDSSMVVPLKGLSTVLVDGATAYLANHHSSVLLNTSVGRFLTEGERVTGVVLSNGETISPRAVISAVPQFDMPKLLGGGIADQLPMMDRLHHFVTSPIVSIHLWFDRHFIAEEFVGLLDSPVHWIFNKSAIYGGSSDGRQYLSLVISAAGRIAEAEKEEIIAMALGELRRFYPESAHAVLVRSLVIKEKRATFVPAPGMEHYRPGHRTPLMNFFLAGDWTATRLPATIEGAAQSGYACSDLARRYLDRQPERR